MNVRQSYPILCEGSYCGGKNLEKNKKGAMQCKLYEIRRREGRNRVVEIATRKETGERMPCKGAD